MSFFVKASIIKGILAVLAGVIAGMAVNMGLINLGPSIIPSPEGVDVTKVESIVSNIGLYEPKHFIMPFLAHALGTLVGAFVASKIALGKAKLIISLSIGAFFLLGGAMMVSQIPAPLWFNVLDLAIAYIPMGWLGWKLGK